MEVWQAVVMGVVQGLTEFLPVSSSGHIEIAREVLGVRVDDNMQLTMMLHAGTVLSTIVVFWGEIRRLMGDLFKFRLNEGTLFIINLVIASLPIAFVGLMFRDRIEGLFSGNLLLVGAMLLVTAGLLIWSGRVGAGAAQRPQGERGGHARGGGALARAGAGGGQTGVARCSPPRGAAPDCRPASQADMAACGGRPVTPKSAFVIGIAQAVAVLPGLSRSGATISAGLLQGVRRETVAKFSFLMALIPIIGESVLEVAGGGAAGVMTAPMLAGFLAAFATGWAACRWMVRLVTRGKLAWFAVYCAVVGLFAIVYSIV